MSGQVRMNHFIISHASQERIHYELSHYKFPVSRPSQLNQSILQHNEQQSESLHQTNPVSHAFSPVYQPNQHHQTNQQNDQSSNNRSNASVTQTNSSSRNLIGTLPSPQLPATSSQSSLASPSQTRLATVATQAVNSPTHANHLTTSLPINQPASQATHLANHPKLMWPTYPKMQTLPTFNKQQIELKSSAHRSTMANCSRVLNYMATGESNNNDDEALSSFLISFLSRRSNHQVLHKVEEAFNCRESLKKVVNNVKNLYDESPNRLKPQVASVLYGLSYDEIHDVNFNISRRSFNHMEDHAQKNGVGQPITMPRATSRAPPTPNELNHIEHFLTKHSQPFANRTFKDKDKDVVAGRVLQGNVRYLHMKYKEECVQHPEYGRSFHVTKFSKIVKSFKYFKKLQGRASDMCVTCNTGAKAERDARAVLQAHGNECCLVNKNLNNILNKYNKKVIPPNITKAVEDKLRAETIEESSLLSLSIEKLEDFRELYHLHSDGIPCHCGSTLQVQKLWELSNSLLYFYHHYHLKNQRRYEYQALIDKLPLHTLLIPFDFKANLVINRGPIEIGSQYYNRKHVGLLGHCVYERLKNGKLKSYFIDVLSACLNHDSYAAMEQLFLATKEALRRAINPIKQIYFFSDTGNHFQCHASITQISLEMPQLIKEHLIERGVVVHDLDTECNCDASIGAVYDVVSDAPVDGQSHEQSDRNVLSEHESVEQTDEMLDHHHVEHVDVDDDVHDACVHDHIEESRTDVNAFSDRVQPESIDNHAEHHVSRVKRVNGDIWCLNQSDCKASLDFFIESHGKSVVDAHFSLVGKRLNDAVSKGSIYTIEQLEAALKTEFADIDARSEMDNKQLHGAVFVIWKPLCHAHDEHGHHDGPNQLNDWAHVQLNDNNLETNQMSSDIDVVTMDEISYEQVPIQHSPSSLSSIRTSHNAVNDTSVERDRADVGDSVDISLIDDLPVRRDMVNEKGKTVLEGRTSCHTAIVEYELLTELPANEINLSYHWSCPQWPIYQKLKASLRTSGHQMTTRKLNQTKLFINAQLTSTIGESRALPVHFKLLRDVSYSLDFGARLTINHNTKFSNVLLDNMHDRGRILKAARNAEPYVAVPRRRAAPAKTADVSVQSELIVSEASSQTDHLSVAVLPTTPTRKRERDVSDSTIHSVPKRQRIDSTPAKRQLDENAEFSSAKRQRFESVQQYADDSEQQMSQHNKSVQQYADDSEQQLSQHNKSRKRALQIDVTDQPAPKRQHMMQRTDMSTETESPSQVMNFSNQTLSQSVSSEHGSRQSPNTSHRKQQVGSSNRAVTAPAKPAVTPRARRSHRFVNVKTTNQSHEPVPRVASDSVFAQPTSSLLSKQSTTATVHSPSSAVGVSTSSDVSLSTSSAVKVSTEDVLSSSTQPRKRRRANTQQVIQPIIHTNQSSGQSAAASQPINILTASTSQLQSLLSQSLQDMHQKLYGNLPP